MSGYTVRLSADAAALIAFKVRDGLPLHQAVSEEVEREVYEAFPSSLIPPAGADGKVRIGEVV